MSRFWSAVPESEREALYRGLALDLAVDDLVPGEAAAATRPPRFDELYAAALDPDAAPAPSFAARFAARPESQRVFESLLRDTAICWFPVAAAAAGGDEGLVAREEDGFEISIRTSSADGDQVYILIRLPEGREGKPVALVAIPASGAPMRVALPEDIDGVYQLIELGDSTIVRAIRDPASKLALV
ncbi:MAG: hypothetical protein OXP07_08445 [Defluviicoccus sp.]|nr:hypothetical protein [Defluviicoccus sp.]